MASRHSRRHRFAAWLVLATTAAALLACQHNGPRVFVANAGDDTVSVVDHATEREIAVLAVGRFPQGIAARAQPPLVAVANSRGSSVSLIDPIALRVVGEPIRVGSFPMHVAFLPDGRLVAVSYDGQSLSIIDPEAHAVDGDPIDLGGRAQRVAVTPGGAFAIVLLHEDPGRVAIVDLSTRGVRAFVPTEAFPTALALHPDGQSVFVASINGNSVTRIDLGDTHALARFPIDTGHGLAVDAAVPRLYSVATLEGEVIVYDYERQTEVARIGVGEDPMHGALTPNGKYLYVPNGTSGNLMKLDTATGRVLLRIVVGSEPSDAVVVP